MDKVTPFHDIEGLGWQIQQQFFFLINLCSTDILVTFIMSVLWSSLEDYVMQYAQENDVIYHPKS
jgi:hypothetical protein